MKWRMKPGPRRPSTATGWSSPADLRRVYPGGAVRVLDRGPGCDPRPAAVEMPGLSVMDVEVLAAGQLLVIRCPGCDAAQLVSLQPGGPPVRPAFEHRSAGCPIRRRIEAAMVLEQAVTAAAERQ